MSTLPMVYVTETKFAVGDSKQFWDSPEQTQILEWCMEHGINPEAMPLDNDLVRDADAMTITYVSVEASSGSQAFTRGDQIHYRVVKQLDEPPAPWPDAVAAHIGETVSDLGLRPPLIADIEPREVDSA